MTYTELKTALGAAAGVVAGQVVERLAPAPIGEGFEGLHRADLVYWQRGGLVSTKRLVSVLIEGFGAQGETATWINAIPEVLQTAVFFDGHNNGPFSRAQIEDFCNDKYVELLDPFVPASIKNFSVSRTDGLTVRVDGLFNVADPNVPWTPRSFFLRYPTAGTNPLNPVIEEIAVV